MSFYDGPTIHIRADATQAAAVIARTQTQMQTLAKTATAGFGARLAAGMKANLMAIGGALTIGSAFAGAKHITEWADEIETLSTRTGVSIKNIQLLQRVAQASRTDIESFVNGLAKLSKAQTEAAGGDKTKLAAFGRFGIGGADLKSDPFTVLRKLSAALAGMQMTSQVTADIMELMGRGGGSLVPAMRENIDALAKSADELGSTVDEKFIRRLSEVGDGFTYLALTIRDAFVPAVATIGGAISWAVGGAAKIAGKYGLYGMLSPGIGKRLQSTGDMLMGNASPAAKTFSTAADYEAVIADEKEIAKLRETNSEKLSRMLLAQYGVKKQILELDREAAGLVSQLSGTSDPRTQQELLGQYLDAETRAAELRRNQRAAWVDAALARLGGHLGSSGGGFVAAGQARAALETANASKAMLNELRAVRNHFERGIRIDPTTL